MGIYKYLTIRTINMVLVLLLVMGLTFALFSSAFDQIKITEIKQLCNGELTEMIKTGKIRLDDKEAIDKFKNECTNRYIQAFGLDKPWYIRIWGVLWDIITFNFGNAYYPTFYGENSEKVSEIILARLPRTVLLLGTATIIITILGLYLGLKASNKPQSFLDKSVIIVGLTSNAFAAWWVGMLLQSIFSYQCRNAFPNSGFCLPDRGIIDYVNPPTNLFEMFVQVSTHLILPVTSLVLVSFGAWALVVRNLLISTLAEDFIMVAKAKGVPENKILFGHALKTAAPPIITIITLSFAGIFGGAIITETVFSWYGMGMLIWQALQLTDMPIILAFFFISTILIILANFIADILYGIFDPRVKTG